MKWDNFCHIYGFVSNFTKAKQIDQTGYLVSEKWRYQPNELREGMDSRTNEIIRTSHQALNHKLTEDNFLNFGGFYD